MNRIVTKRPTVYTSSEVIEVMRLAELCAEPQVNAITEVEKIRVERDYTNLKMKPGEGLFDSMTSRLHTLLRCKLIRVHLDLAGCTINTE